MADLIKLNVCKNSNCDYCELEKSFLFEFWITTYDEYDENEELLEVCFDCLQKKLKEFENAKRN